MESRVEVRTRERRESDNESDDAIMIREEDLMVAHDKEGETSPNGSENEGAFMERNNFQMFQMPEEIDAQVYNFTGDFPREDDPREESKVSKDNNAVFGGAQAIGATRLSESLDAIAYDTINAQDQAVTQEHSLPQEPQQREILEKSLKRIIYDKKFQRFFLIPVDSSISKKKHEVLIDERFYSEFAKVFMLLTSKPTLEKLEFYSCHFSPQKQKESKSQETDLDLQYETQFPNVQSLALRSSQTDEESFRFLLKSLPKLKKFALTDYKGENLLELLKVLEKLVPELELEKLDISGALSLFDPIDEEDQPTKGKRQPTEYERQLMALLEPLLKKEGLKSLKLSENKFSSPFTDYLTKSLVSSKSLRSLSLADCLMSSAELRTLMKSNFSSIKKLILGGNNFEGLTQEDLRDFLGGIPGLTKLNLRRCSLNLGQVEWLLSKSPKTLEEVDLSDNDLGDQIFKVLLPLKLKRLTLQNCNLTFQGEIELPNSLNYLDVSNQAKFRNRESAKEAKEIILTLARNLKTLTVVCYGIELGVQDSILQESVITTLDSTETATENKALPLSQRLQSGEILSKARLNADLVEDDFKKHCDRKFDEKHLHREAKKRQMRKSASLNQKVFSDLVFIELLKGTTTGFPKERIVYQGSLIQQISGGRGAIEVPTAVEAMEKIRNLLEANDIPFRYEKKKFEEEISFVFVRMPQNGRQNLISVPLKVISYHREETIKIVFVLHKDARSGIEDMERRNRAIADVAGYLNADLSYIAQLSSFTFEIEKDESRLPIYSVRLRCSTPVSNIRNAVHWFLFSVDIGMMIIGCLQEEYLTERRVVDDIVSLYKSLSRKMQALVGEYQKSSRVEELCQ